MLKDGICGKCGEYTKLKTLRDYGVESYFQAQKG